MAGSTNRSLKVKAEKARKQSLEAGRIEGTKLVYLRERKADNRRVAAMVARLAAHI